MYGTRGASPTRFMVPNTRTRYTRVHVYVRSRRFDVSVRPMCSAVGRTPYIFEGIERLYLGGHEKILLRDDFRGKTRSWCPIRGNSRTKLLLDMSCQGIGGIEPHASTQHGENTLNKPKNIPLSRSRRSQACSFGVVHFCAGECPHCPTDTRSPI